MEQLVVTREGAWAEVEVLQWLERNTMMFRESFGGAHAYAAPLNSCYQSRKKINELLGIKEVMR